MVGTKSRDYLNSGRLSAWGYSGLFLAHTPALFVAVSDLVPNILGICVQTVKCSVKELNPTLDSYEADTSQVWNYMR